MTRVPNADVFAALLRDAALSDAEVSSRVDRACDADYWRSLTSDVSVLDSCAALDSQDSAEAAVQSAIASVRDDGVFQLPPVLADRSLRALNAAVDAVVRAGWPAVFAFVYDQPWLCARLPSLARVVTGALGVGYQQIPHVFTHVVQPRRGASGWPPHVDGYSKGRLSVWVPLTAATLDNGCMYVVPSSAVALEIAARPEWMCTLTGDEALALFHGSRAMPTPAGAPIGWRFDVVHWGGRVMTPGAERRAFSLEFIAAGQEPAGDEHPLVSPDGPLPSWPVRLRGVAAALDTYRKFDLPLLRFRRFATAVLDRVHPEDCQ